MSSSAWPEVLSRASNFEHCTNQGAIVSATLNSAHLDQMSIGPHRISAAYKGQENCDRVRRYGLTYWRQGWLVSIASALLVCSASVSTADQVSYSPAARSADVALLPCK